MHHRAEIVRRIEVIEPLRINVLEPLPSVWENVFPVDSDVAISVDMSVHVMIAECVDGLVHHYSLANAANVAIHRQLLSATDSSEPRPASVAVYYLDEIIFVCSRHKPDAGLAFDESELSKHKLNILSRCKAFSVDLEN